MIDSGIRFLWIASHVSYEIVFLVEMRSMHLLFLFLALWIRFLLRLISQVSENFLL